MDKRYKTIIKRIILIILKIVATTAYNKTRITKIATMDESGKIKHISNKFT